MADNPTTPNSGMTFNPNILNRGSTISGNEWLIFFFALLLYILDIFILKFDGVNLVSVWRTLGVSGLTSLLIKGIILNVVFWVILAFFYFIKKPENKDEFMSLMFLTASIFFVASLTGLRSFISTSNLASLIHLLFIVFGIRNGLLVNKYGKTTANYYTIMIIFLDFFAFNIISAVFPANAINLNRIIIPILVLATLFHMESSNARAWILFGITVFYILILAHTYRANFNFQKNLDNSQIEGAKTQTLSAWDKFKAIFTGAQQSWNQSNQDINGIYAGQVEANQAKPLGVFLEDIKASDSEFFVGEKVEVWAKLKAYSFENNKDPVKIRVVCYAKDGNNITMGEISPKDGNFEVSSFEEEFLICSFPDTTKFPKTAGMPTVTFNATFNFETQSYLKTYYIDKERKRTLSSQGVNIFQEYGITDTNPIAIYTNGPIKIGMETTPPPIGVPSNPDDFTSFIGLTIDRHWTKGNVVNLTSLDITLPSGLMLDKSCTSLTLTSGATQTDGAKYVLSNAEIKSDNLKEYKLPKSYMCSLKLSNYQTLLGSTPISIKYFKTNVKYTYMISESTTINIKPKPA